MGSIIGLYHNLIIALRTTIRYCRKILCKPSKKRRSIKPRVFLISDTHFGHKNIISHCKRPFRTVGEMDSEILKRWNNAVHNADYVYILGDFVIHGSIGSWYNKLHGRKKFIRGNHDYHLKKAIPHKIIRYKHMEFYLVHNPTHVPRSWRGWVIHGHVHNWNTEVFPFINGNKKRINVSAELLNYRPVNLDYIISLDLQRIRMMKTIHSPIEYYKK